MGISVRSFLRVGRGRVRLLAAAIPAIGVLPAQLPNAPDWETVAGGGQTFEVASVKPAKAFHVPNFPLNTGDAKPAGGRLSATFGLMAYIAFAYKLPPYLAVAMAAQLPKWATTDSFEIDARAAGNPTKASCG